MTKDEALKLALDALEYIHEGANNQGPHTGISWRCVSNKAEPAITALRERLAQPAQQQEPVAWMWRCKPYCDWPEWSVSLKRPADSGRDGHKRTEGYEDVPLYTSPPASKPWVGLSDEAVWSLYKNLWMFHPAEEPRLAGDILKFARAIEAAHGIKGEA